MSAGRINVADKHGKSALLVVRLESGVELVLSEPGSKRRAAAWLWSPAELEAELAHTGPEPLDPAFTPEVLREAMQRRPGQLHAFLRDQRNVAGIGRGYSDEILHEAKLSPFARTATLDDEQVARLHAAIVRQLSDAVERMVPLSTKGLAGHAHRGYTVHDHAGEPCQVCGDTIRTRLLRGAHGALLPDLPDRRPDPRRPPHVEAAALRRAKGVRNPGTVPEVPDPLGTCR